MKRARMLAKELSYLCPQPTVFMALCLGKDLKLVMHFVTSSQQTQIFHICFSTDID